MKKQTGFTLIELMIVVAIIAILAAIAIPAYNQYILEARIAKVIDHMDSAVRATKAELAKRAAKSARDSTFSSVLTDASLIAAINPERRLAPLGGVPAFNVAIDDTNGAVRVEVTTETFGQEEVVIERPSLGGKIGGAGTTVYINAVDL